jgi:hypothetical protein
VATDFPSPALLEYWRSDSDRLERFTVSGVYIGASDIRLLCQRLAALVDALTTTRAELARIPIHRRPPFTCPRNLTSACYGNTIRPDVCRWCSGPIEP